RQSDQDCQRLWRHVLSGAELCLYFERGGLAGDQFALAARDEYFLRARAGRSDWFCFAQRGAGLGAAQAGLAPRDDGRGLIPTSSEDRLNSPPPRPRPSPPRRGEGARRAGEGVVFILLN